MNKIEQIKDCIEWAKNLQSKMDQTAWDVPALSSLRIRHLMNNLGSISTRYLECGVHKSGLFCSTLRNNPNISVANANDSFASDETSEDKAYPQFWANTNKCKSPETQLNILINDTFLVDPIAVIGPVDLYLFDASHDYDSERKAVTHFLPAMADTFILCKDDWQYGDVKAATLDGIKDSGCDVLFEQELLNTEPYTEDEHRNHEFWRGFYIALLKKKS